MKEQLDIFTEETIQEISNSVIAELGIGKTEALKIPLARWKGKVIAVGGNAIQAMLPGAIQGQICSVCSEVEGEDRIHDEEIIAEVTAVNGNRVVLQPYISSLTGISGKHYIQPLQDRLSLLAGDYLKGSVVDGIGRVLFASKENAKYIGSAKNFAVDRDPPNALTRPIIDAHMSVGVRCIDTLLMLGRGQRVGIFAPAGVGKSTLLGMITRFADADVVVLGLIGERGREVNEFLKMVLGEEARKKAIVVVSTSDRPAIEKIKAIYTATSIAEYFRDEGKDVLLLVDSITRFARAQRDVAVATGEFIPTSGFPASVFAELPRLLERTGQSSKGSITALYTILVDNEKASDVIAEEVRSILDGHIILSRNMASSNHYPAIDSLASISRVMAQIATEEQIMLAGKTRNLLSKYEEIQLLVRVGEFRKGEDSEADEALLRHSDLINFLKQKVEDYTSMDDSFDRLREALNE